MSGQTCEKWRLVDVKGEKVNKYTIWVRYKVSFEYRNLIFVACCEVHV